MERIDDIGELNRFEGPLHLAIGVFDGLHRGHQAVIRCATESALASGGTPVVVTFQPHPVRVLAPERAPQLITSTRHKLRLMDAQGIRQALVIPFDEAFAQLDGRTFVKKLHAAAPGLHRICVGESWAFGRGRSGDVSLLRELGREMGFSVSGVRTIEVEGTVASSTAIREAVACGDLQTAAAMLGRPYTVLGTVVEGQQLGRKLGFPTANLGVQNEQLPPSGVYAVQVERVATGARLGGVANLGVRPTIESDREAGRRLEVHLFDFEGDLYDADLEVRFLSYLRQERAFDGLEALKAQITRDCEAARAALAGPV